MKPVFLLRLLLFLLLTRAQAQDIKRLSRWYFGDSAGINFNTNPPTPLTDGKLFSYEGSSVMSDTAGNLLFYSNGATVWNKNHQVMDNGTDIEGTDDATQGCLIVPQPGNDSLYYLFTTDAVGSIKGFKYSIINIYSNGGLGKVVQKNINLLPRVTEKLAATKHANGRDYWVLVHGFPNRKFYAYLLGPEGLSPCPVITEIGSLHGNKDVFGQPLLYTAQGAMKFTPDGKKLVVSVYDDLKSQNFDLFKFNSASGMLSDYIIVKNIELAYGVEFSPDQSKVYITNRINHLYQVDLSIWDSTYANNHVIKIWDAGDLNSNFYTQLVLGPNKKIYVAIPDSLKIGIIQNPDSPGIACAFQRGAFHLGAKTSQYGLPNYVSSFLYQPTLDFGYSHSCTTKSYQFKMTAGSPNAPRWYFKHIASGNKDSSTLVNPVYTFSDTGSYQVLLIQGTDSVRKFLYFDPPLSLGKDTAFCAGTSLVLSGPARYRCWQWNTGSDSNSTKISQVGTYTASAYDVRNCLISDTIVIAVFPAVPLQKPLADSLLFCKGKSITLEADSGANFRWNDGVTQARRQVDSAGFFFCTWNDLYGCPTGDSIRLKTYNIAKPIVQKQLDSLWTNASYTSWLWYQNGIPLSSQNKAWLKATQNGYYQVAVRDTGFCMALSDSIHLANVSVEQPLQAEFYLYPNPVHSGQTLYIQNPKNLPFLLQLQSVTGAVLLEETHVHTTVSLPQLPAGIYLLSIRSSTGQYYQKLIIR